MKSHFLMVVACVAVTAAVFSCGKKDEDKPAATNSACDSTQSYSGGIKTIVDTNCASCHGTGGQKADLPLDTLAAIQARKTEAKAAIVDKKTMPPSNTSFGETADGKKLTSWLSCDTLKE